MEILSHVEKLTLDNGVEVNLTMNFGRLFAIKSKCKADVETALKLFNATNTSDLDVLDLATFIWVAYLCANPEPEYTRAEFMTVLPFNINLLGNLFAAIIAPKKK